MGVGAQLAWVANIDAEPFPPFDSGGHKLAAESGADHHLHLSHRKAVAGQGVVIRRDVEVEAACYALGKRAGCAGHRLHNCFNLRCQPLDSREIHAEYLDANGRSDAGGEHIQAPLNGHCPAVGDAGKFQRLVHLGDELVHRHSWPPLFLRFEVNHRLEHFHRRRVGGRGRAARLAKHRGHLWEALDDPVLRLHELSGLGNRHTRKRGWHIQQRALVESRHELATELPRRQNANDQNHQRYNDCHHLPTSTRTR